jgi:hypothetical protein
MIFVGRKFKWSENNLRLNVYLRGEKPATNRLRYGTDQQVMEYGKGNGGKRQKGKIRRKG